MLFRSLLAALALTAAVADSEARPSRWRAQPSYQSSYRPAYQPTHQPAYPSPTYQPVYPSSTVTPTVVMPVGGTVTTASPEVTYPATHVSGYAPSVDAAGFPVAGLTAPATGFGSPVAGFNSPGAPAGDGLDEVNAKRAARGLRPYIRDEGLTQAAFACAQHRAARRLFGHSSNDFAFVPAGTSARSAGCAAYPASHGWMSCCTYDNYTYAGAAWVTGGDGKRYMHLYVR
jgi:hypothetical protein